MEPEKPTEVQGVQGEDIRYVFGPEVKTEADSTLGPEGKMIHPWLLGLTQIIAAQHGGRDDLKNTDNLMGFLEEEIKNYQNSEYDNKYVDEVKQELFQWMEAFKHHINSVWEGVLEGVFNPARGRGGNTQLQQEIVAAYMVADWKKVSVKNARQRAFIVRKMGLYAKYETLQGGETFQATSGSLLSRVYGEGFTWSGGVRPTTPGTLNQKGEYMLQNLGDWAHMISWFTWKYIMAKKVVKARLHHPVPLRVLKDIKPHYDEILNWLSKSPNGYSASSPKN
jgi:hypothetical protein